MPTIQTSLRQALKNSSWFFALSFMALRSHANSLPPRMEAACYMIQQDKVEGVGLDRMLPIASVSKVFTTHWAIVALGPEYRFRTRFWIERTGKNSARVHIQGSHDPYTGREMMQFVVGELNRLGITEISDLSFDEKFKFLIHARASHVAQGYFLPEDPSIDRVSYNLKTFFENPTTQYQNLRQVSKNYTGLELPDKLQIRVKRVFFRGSEEFEAKPEHEVYEYQSTTLSHILKEMNRNSNNHAANQIFEFLGGAKAFHLFIRKQLPEYQNYVEFYNGSGDRYQRSNETRFYNQASCRAVIAMLVDLNRWLKVYKLSLEDVLPVAGQDYRGEPSTVTQVYNNPTTSGVLVAKTGTVNPSISLAGQAHTKEGPVFFHFVYSTRGPDQWGTGRTRIAAQVNQMIQRFGGPAPHNKGAEVSRFLPFDSNSTLKKIDLRMP